MARGRRGYLSCDTSPTFPPPTPPPPGSVGDYQKAGCMAGLEGNLHSFQLDADF